jgi:L-lactate dehydrogenase complex protein LldE
VTATTVGPVTVLFPTCLGDLVMADAVRHTDAALRACGLDVRPARGVTCCGQPGFTSGHHAHARRVARTTLRALDRTEGDVVVPSGSCAAMMRLHWRELFHGTRDAGAAGRVSRRVREATTVLAAHVEALRGRGLAWTGRVGYHDSCHMLRELGVRAEPRMVLDAVEGLEIVPLASSERCCGFGGAFAIRYPDLSVAMADSKLDDARAADVDAVVSADPGCLMHLGGRAARTGGRPRLVHVATLLHEAGLR